ncbi:hypothetical protein DWQ65_10520 [Treponema phagedenis]|nr:hypothetical protein C5O78_09210 [Treponema phagedenis]QSI00482.1 hypothetical protein DWQ65_10520 [Treponema phagedenis]
MVNYPPLLNSKRCFKASTQNCKIEALKLVGEVTVNFQNFAPAQFQTMFSLILQRKQAKLVGEPTVEIPRVRPCAVSGSFYKIFLRFV